MTVKELIAALEGFDADAPVLMNQTDGLMDWLCGVDAPWPCEVRQMTTHPSLQGNYVEKAMADAGERVAPNNGVKCGPPIVAIVLG